MRARYPHDDPPARRRNAPYRRPPVTLSFAIPRLPTIPDLLLHRAVPSQRGGRRRSMAGRNRGSGPLPQGGMHEMRDDRRGRAAELARPIGTGEPDGVAFALMVKCKRA